MDGVQKAIEGLRQIRGQLTGELERVDTAIAALEQAPSQPKKRPTKKPCCTKNDVIQIVSGLLRDNGSLPRVDLEELAKEKISHEQGKSLSGFAMRFKEALDDPLVIEFSPDQYRLTDSRPIDDRKH